MNLQNWRKKIPVPFQKNDEKNQGLTLEEAVFEGRTCGIPFFNIYDLTLLEIKEYIDVNREKRRRINQDKSIIAYAQASVIASFIASPESVPSIYDIFPYWNSDEIAEIENQAKVEKIMNYFKSN